MSEKIEPKKMPRRGTLYAFSTVHIAAKKWKKPMCIGYVDLPNKARVFTHLQGSDLAIGDEVEVAMGTVGEDENGPIEPHLLAQDGHLFLRRVGAEHFARDVAGREFGHHEYDERHHEKGEAEKEQVLEEKARHCSLRSESRQ